ncbi:YdjY domain-containing protein [Planctomycetes bacterium K23_9]|uniref:Uncharacterized protein n=1 Tax=Stieleria marina TaxID=1930275 RepID=A0A517NY71_9BACT|nr:hypothetical protein K239x_40850 [Planctomycetes bacterium K23_9]
MHLNRWISPFKPWPVNGHSAKACLALLAILGLLYIGAGIPVSAQEATANPPGTPATQPNAAKPTATKPALPQPGPAKSKLGAALADDAAKRERGEMDQTTVVDEYFDDYIGHNDVARASFLAPPGATSLSKTNNLWVDQKRHRVYADGYVAMREGGLEMFACSEGTKEHESVVATLAKAKEVHAALLAIGAKPGSPVRFRPDFVPPKGQKIRVWVCWRDKAGKFHISDARRWVLKNGTTDEQMNADWVFGGSGFWKDPADGREYYRADGGDMICVSNFTTAMMDVNTSSSAEADNLMYIPFTDRIPPRGTPVRLILTPLQSVTKDSQKPAKGDPSDAQKVDSAQPPKEMVLPENPQGKLLKAKKEAAEKAEQ